jgi:hypothetical protein
MANRLAKYNPDHVAITAAGVLIQGYADGEFVVIEHMTDQFQEEVGTDGEVVVSPSNDRRMKITIKLMQTSQSNPVLSSLLNAQLNAAGPMPTFEIQVEDTDGGTTAHGSEAWIAKWPSSSFDRTAKSREWEIHVAFGTRDEAGN